MFGKPPSNEIEQIILDAIKNIFNHIFEKFKLKGKLEISGSFSQLSNEWLIMLKIDDEEVEKEFFTSIIYDLEYGLRHYRIEDGDVYTNIYGISSCIVFYHRNMKYLDRKY